MSAGTVVRADDLPAESLAPEKILQPAGGFRIETRVHMNGREFIVDGNPRQPLPQEPEEEHAVLPAGDGDDDPVPVFDQSIMVQRFPHETAHFLVDKSHDVCISLQNARSGFRMECQRPSKAFPRMFR